MTNEQKKEYVKKHFEEKPWLKTYYLIIGRCRKNGAYGIKGIKNFLTPEHLQYLWERDEASKMVRPSIDRIDPTKDYTLYNCRYLELSENTKRVIRIKRGNTTFNITSRHIPKILEVADQMTLEEASKHVNLRPKYISKIFKQSCGIGYQEYRTLNRIETAKNLLSEMKTVKEVSKEIGYCRPESFIRTFKKFVGITPTEFKRG